MQGDPIQIQEENKTNQNIHIGYHKIPQRINKNEYLLIL
jgi:hypothetical protein